MKYTNADGLTSTDVGSLVLAIATKYEWVGRLDAILPETIVYSVLAARPDFMLILHKQHKHL